MNARREITTVTQTQTALTLLALTAVSASLVMKGTDSFVNVGAVD